MLFTWPLPERLECSRTLRESQALAEEQSVPLHSYSLTYILASRSCKQECLRIFVQCKFTATSIGLLKNLLPAFPKVLPPSFLFHRHISCGQQKWSLPFCWAVILIPSALTLSLLCDIPTGLQRCTEISLQLSFLNNPVLCQCYSKTASLKPAFDEPERLCHAPHIFTCGFFWIVAVINS